MEHQDPSTVYNQYAGYMNGIVQVLKSYASTFGRAFFATINSGRCDEFQVQQQYPVLISFVSYVSCSPETGDFNATTNPSLQPMEDFAQLKASITATVNVPIMVFVDWPDQQNALGNEGPREVKTRVPETPFHMQSADSRWNSAGPSYCLKTGHSLAARTFFVEQCLRSWLPFVNAIHRMKQLTQAKMRFLREGAIRLVRLK